MSAFAAAIDLIFADPNMAVQAAWLPGGLSPGQSVRVIRKAADQVTGFGAAHVWSESMMIDVRVSEVAQPAPGDRIVIAGETFDVQGEPLRDRERLVWTLELVPA